MIFRNPIKQPNPLRKKLHRGKSQPKSRLTLCSFNSSAFRRWSMDFHQILFAGTSGSERPTRRSGILASTRAQVTAQRSLPRRIVGEALEEGHIQPFGVSAVFHGTDCYGTSMKTNLLFSASFCRRAKSLQPSEKNIAE